MKSTKMKIKIYAMTANKELKMDKFEKIAREEEPVNKKFLREILGRKSLNEKIDYIIEVWDNEFDRRFQIAIGASDKTLLKLRVLYKINYIEYGKLYENKGFYPWQVEKEQRKLLYKILNTNSIPNGFLYGIKHTRIDY